MDKYGYIYKVENDVNNKIYIGQTMQIPERRFKDHLRNKRSNDKFHKAIREIGPSHFKLEILENVNRDSLDEREKYWIEYFKAYKDGYNSTPGGRGYPVGWYAPIEVIEARLIFESREELCRILSNYFHINLPYLRIESNMEKHFNFHLRYTNSRIFSSMKRINKWLETLTCNNLLKGIKCIDTGMEFESITDAANYYINNELYTGRSQGNVKQSVVTSISQNLLGKTEFVSVLNNYKFEYTNIISKQRERDANKNPYVKQKVKCIEKDLNFNSAKEAAEYLTKNVWKDISVKTARSRISDVLRGHISDYKELHFEYI